jgi:hypothetical protein
MFLLWQNISKILHQSIHKYRKYRKGVKINTKVFMLQKSFVLDMNQICFLAKTKTFHKKPTWKFLILRKVVIVGENRHYVFKKFVRKHHAFPIQTIKKLSKFVYIHKIHRQNLAFSWKWNLSRKFSWFFASFAKSETKRKFAILPGEGGL